MGFVVRPAFVVVVGTTGEAFGGGLAGRGVRAGKGVRAGALSLTGVDGWLLPGSLSLILGLPSVGVGGIAGGGMVAGSGADGPADERANADEPALAGKYDVGEIKPGVSTGGPENEASFREADAEAGPLEDTDGVLLIFSFRVFLVFSMASASRKISTM